MTNLPGFNIAMIGDRINPGFKPTRVLVENHDIAGLQALAVRQVESGASYLDVTIGPRAFNDHRYLAETVHALQEAVTVPLCFDYPDRNLQEVCFKAYDRARGGPALINSITEQRWEIMDLYKNYGPFRVIVMASERMEDGIAKQNKTADEIASTAKRAALRLQSDYGMSLNDIYIDVSVSAVVADTNGLHRATLDAVHVLHTDAQLRGMHIMGGLTNIGQQLPPKAADGSDLKLSLECAFLTLAVPLGFDTILCTPWRNYHPLPDDNYVLAAYKNILGQTGSNALRAVRKLYRA
ncbi:MAG TPA: dihydropteroate synthase [Pseudolabrys sp.]|nr:dihydropteroate synthase [Pseudolabrys sp.]